MKNAISYILNEEKTKNGLLVGGNAGVTTEEIYQTFLDTKEFYGKQGGRQGYHFVLSWKPGTVTEDQVYDMMEAFCQEYLKDEYDYVFLCITIRNTCMAILFLILFPVPPDINTIIPMETGRQRYSRLPIRSAASLV